MNEEIKQIENEVEERNFDFKRFLIKYVRYWYIFVISLILGL